MAITALGLARRLRPLTQRVNHLRDKTPLDDVFRIRKLIDQINEQIRPEDHEAADLLAKIYRTVTATATGIGRPGDPEQLTEKLIRTLEHSYPGQSVRRKSGRSHKTRRHTRRT